MRLYYFTGQGYGLDAIRTRSLKIARISELNDPFELLAPVYDTEGEQRSTDFWIKQMSDRYGLLCMSADWHHPLLWGHYADKNRGICLAFDTLQRRRFSRVQYVAHRPSFRDFGLASLSDMNEETMRKILYRKFSAWSYETEYRAFVDLQSPDDRGLYFAEFPPALKLVEVIVGCRSTATRDEVAESIGNLGEVEVFRARPSSQDFELVRDNNELAWH